MARMPLLLVMGIVAGLSVGGLLAAPDPKLPPAVELPANACEAVGANALDGDTIHANYIALPWGVALRNESVRAADYDAWEASRVRFGAQTTEEELARGKRAAQALQALRSRGELYVVPIDRPRDNYGRLLARFYLRLPDGSAINVRSFMSDGGHLRK